MNDNTTDLKFDKSDANELSMSIPGPYFDGDDFAGRLQDFQDWLTVNGYEDDTDELEAAFLAFQDASGDFHSAVRNVLQRHNLR